MGLDYTGDDKAEIDQKLNDGVLDMLRRTRCYVKTLTISETAGTGDYTLDTGILSIVGWSFTSSVGAGVPEQVSPQEILRLRALATVDDYSAYPTAFYALAGSNLLMLWPTPASADTITVYHVPRPTALSASDDDPSDAANGGIPAEYHYGLELYALWKMGDSNDDQSSGQGERYRLMYEGQDGRGGYLAQMRAELNRKAGPRKAQFPQGRRRRAFAFRDQHD